MRAPTTHRYGDAGVLVQLTDVDQEVRWARAQAIADDLSNSRRLGITDLVASFDTVFIAYDPLVSDYAAVSLAVRRSAEANSSAPDPRTFYLPVVYGGDFGPDLAEVAAEQGISAQEMVELHCQQLWVVRFRGAPAASPMMDGGAWSIPVARCASPRIRVAAGSVAVSGKQSVVYTVSSPGGWRLLGRTPVQLVDVHRSDIAPYRPGDRIQFVPVPAASWNDWTGTLHDMADDLVERMAVD